MSVRIIQGDCREVLQTLEPATFDCCITDPPYGETSLAWDRKCAGWILPMARTLKPNGSLWVFGSMRFLSPLTTQLESHGFKYAQDIVWEKHNGSGFSDDRFRRVHEHVVQFYRGPWAEVWKDPQFTNDATARTVRRKSKPAHWRGARKESFYESEDGGPRLMRSVIYCRSEHGRAIHETQKPIGIIAPLIHYSCPPQGYVLDCFAGSGSTGLACKIEGRNAVLIEIDQANVDAANLRLISDCPLFADVA